MSGEENTKTFEQKVADLVAQATAGSGGFVLPDDVKTGQSEEVIYAADLALRHRNTQSAYTKSQQELAKNKAMNVALQAQIGSTVQLSLTNEQVAELNTLKKTDPEKWRKLLGQYEGEAQAALTNKLNQIENDSEIASQVEVRRMQLDAFCQATGIQLNDQIINDNLPPKFKKDLEAGTTTFTQFLEKAADYLKRNKVIAGAKDDAPDEKTLGKVTGGAEPDTKAIASEIVKKYDSGLTF